MCFYVANFFWISRPSRLLYAKVQHHAFLVLQQQQRVQVWKQKRQVLLAFYYCTYSYDASCRRYGELFFDFSQGSTLPLCCKYFRFKNTSADVQSVSHDQSQWLCIVKIWLYPLVRRGGKDCGLVTALPWWVHYEKIVSIKYIWILHDILYLAAYGGWGGGKWSIAFQPRFVLTGLQGNPIHWV